MMTEHDLRAALGSLARRDCPTAEMMAGVRAGAVRRRRVRMGGGLAAVVTQLAVTSPSGPRSAARAVTSGSSPASGRSAPRPGSPLMPS